MKVEILRYPTDDDWRRCKLLALNTVGINEVKTVTDDWKHRILKAEHSPIRTLMFTVRMEIPYYASVHFCRHKYGVEHFVKSQRNDRQSEYDRTQAPQGQIVTHIMDINAQELMQMSRKRLCGKADPVTREIMQMIVDEVLKTNPEFDGLLVKMCKYTGDCKEFRPCWIPENK